MSKIHIGIIILSNGWGGAEESTSHIVHNLNKDAFDVTIFTNDFLFEKYQSLGHHTLVNVGHYESNKRLEKIRTIRRIQTKIRKEISIRNIDLVHIRLENSILAVGTMIPRISVPVICTLSGDEARIYQSPKTFEQRVIQRMIHRYITDTGSIVTSVSSWLIKDFYQDEKEKIVVTPNGTNRSLFRPLECKAKSEKKSVLYVGRLVEGKGIEDLVDVARQLPEYEFRFAGTGPLEKLLSLPNTIPLGFIQRNKLVSVYADATICAFPSYAEGMPMVGIEAMACGKAIVASPAGFSDFIEDGIEGIIVEPGNVSQIKSAIEVMLEDDKKRERMEAAALKKAEVYDIRNTVKHYEEVYRQIVKR